jgi:hypothetical protein
VTNITSQNSATLVLGTPAESNKFIYLRYNSDDNTSVCLTGNGFMPSHASSTKLSLGASGNKWSTVYATSFIGNLDWDFITNKPTTLSGYGITNAVEWNANSYYNINQTSGYSTGDLRMIFNNKDGNCLGIGYAAE